MAWAFVKVPASQRFRHFAKKGSADECWWWIGKKSKGYGILNVDGKRTLAHRYSYTLNIGLIPDGMLVCHRCDNPLCVNPSHLFLGTNQDNHADMIAKGRAKGAIVPGEKHSTAKLTEAQVREIRLRRDSGESVKSLSVSFGVSVSQIRHICSRKNWKTI
jgi:hypothetical protein